MAGGGYAPRRIHENQSKKYSISSELSYGRIWSAIRWADSWPWSWPGTAAPRRCVRCRRAGSGWPEMVC